MPSEKLTKTKTQGKKFTKTSASLTQVKIAFMKNQVKESIEAQ